MNGVTVSPAVVVGGVAALLVLFVVWRAGARRARRAADAARSGARLVSLAGRVLFNTALIVGAQWTVMAYPVNAGVRLLVLVLPALVAAFTITKALTVTTIEPAGQRHRGARRRNGGGRS